jgi:hypothetical protein
MSQPLIEPKSKPPYDPLPPVEAPSASFLLQLFLIPLVIVLIIVMVWLLFSWLAHMGTDPKDLVRDIGKMNDASWQRAYNLAELLRKPQYDYIKTDPKIAQDLADSLTALRSSRPQRKHAAKDETDLERKKNLDKVYDNRINLEVFLCKALGEFRVQEGLPALVAAAGPDGTNDPEGFDVRVAAMGAIALRASQTDAKDMQSDEKLMETLIEASKERSEGGYAREEFDKLRSAAAFTLGMVGGRESRDRLAQMLDDADPNTRYNAALGLARHGDPRALETLGEMLDPANTEGLADPDAPAGQAIIARGKSWKRVSIVNNAIRGSRMLIEKQPKANYDELIKWLKAVETSDLIEKVRLDAKGLRLEIEKKRGEPDA